jgi:ribosomal protein S12 methylthiotransferase
MTKVRTVYMISLGCPKNTVDSEVLLGHLARGRYTVVSDPLRADLIVVNTCGFVDEAKQESIDAIIEMGRMKEAGRCRTLAVCGCLVQRYGAQLAKELPEVDHFIGVGGIEDILAIVDGQRPTLRRVGHLRVLTKETTPSRLVLPDPDFTLSSASPRIRTGPFYSAYVKIAEGCSNTCAFCVIPQIRGPQRSRTISDIAREVDRFLEEGTVEINLIAQDLCAYGRDLRPAQSLAALLRTLDRVAAKHRPPVWIRCLYAYPRGLTREVIGVLAEARHILPYLDIPLQHISDRLLRRMQRGKGGPATRDLVRRLRDSIEHLTLRTTFITGLPGETEADFEELLRFVDDMRFERVGVFAFSPQEGTAAATMPRQVAPEVAAARRDRLMKLAQQISRAQQRSLIGALVQVLVHGVSGETELLLEGRHAGQAPEIDGVTYINRGMAAPGEVVTVRIDQASDYDLVGGIEMGLNATI